jgi:hypothetical protein
MLVEPYRRRTRCDGCGATGNLDVTRFHCSCGYVFAAAAVQDALSTGELLRSRLLAYVESMRIAEQNIAIKSKTDLQGWLRRIGFDLGKLMGHLAGKVANLFS